jgi:HD-like signal output (HDOD) protein
VKHALILILLFTAGTLIAAEDPDTGGLYEKIPLTTYQVTPEEVKSSVLEIVLRNWVIDSHTMNSIRAHYKSAELEVIIDNEFVTLKEVTTGGNFNEKWLKTLVKYINQRLQYHHYLRLMTERPKPPTSISIQ